MTALHSLWLPIVLSSVFVFVLSSLIHMATPWHKGDYGAVPDQDEVMDALRPFGIPPGDYMLPRPADMSEMRSQAFLEKLKRGQVAVLTVQPNGMFGWEEHGALVPVPRRREPVRRVRRRAGPAERRALPGGVQIRGRHRDSPGHSLALWQMTIWYRRNLGTTIRATVDGLLYALVTAGTFGWLWPR